MKDKFDVFYFSSTHWDREWYQDFQGFRYRLINMVDALVDLFDKDENYKTFHFDGQTVVLEDYCEISPEKKDRLKELITERKILIGPWYVMPDEFLVSGESLIRNLMIGHKIANEWGTEAWKYGYICDIFGHTAQMPQIFKGFDINYSLLGRGTTETDPKFFRWQAPDVTEILNYKMSEEGGYGNFKQLVYDVCEDKSADNPEVEKKIKEYIDMELARSNEPIIVLMDGLDHALACENTSDYIRKIAELYPEARVHHVDLCEQGKLLENYRDRLPVIKGELNKTAHFRYGYLHLITNTLSSYYTLKKENDKCQNLLEKKIEPICTFAQIDGRPLKRRYVDLAYKFLIRNHPHDSICGCSIDQVHKDMEYRFDQTKDICKELVFDYVWNNTPKRAEKDESQESVLTFFNTLPYAVEKTVTVELPFKQSFKKRYAEPFGYEDINCFRIKDYQENDIPYQVVDIKRNYVDRYYEHRTEQVDMHTVTMKINVPACGKAEYKIVEAETPAVRYMSRLKNGQNWAENDFIRMTVLNNGSIEIFDKKTNRTYTQLGNLVDDGEIGDGWYHANPVNDRAVYSANGDCIIEKVENGPSRCVFKVTRKLTVPKELIWDRFGKRRSDETVELNFVSYVGLSEENRSVDIKMEYDNIAKDHRLRLIMPTGITEEKYFSGQAFCCCERKTGIDIATQDWRETDQYEKSTNGIVGKKNSDGTGIAFVAAEGIKECSAYADEEGTVNITLSRSFGNTVSTNGGTRCQLNQVLSYEYSFVPLDEDVKYSDLVKVQDMMACPVIDKFVTVDGTAEINPPKSYISVDGRDVLVSIIKPAENQEENAIVVRVYNASETDTCGKINITREITSADMVNLNEEFVKKADCDGHSVSFDLPAWRISTFKLYLK